MEKRRAGQTLPDGVEDIQDLEPDPELKSLDDLEKGGTDLLTNISLPGSSGRAQTWQAGDGKPILFRLVDHPVVELRVGRDLVADLAGKPDVIMFEKNDSISIRTRGLSDLNLKLKTSITNLKINGASPRKISHKNRQ